MRVRVLFFKRTVGFFWQKTMGPGGPIRENIRT